MFNSECDIHLKHCTFKIVQKCAFTKYFNTFLFVNDIISYTFYFLYIYKDGEGIY